MLSRCPRQYRHTGCGGWIRAEQSSHRWKRSRPSAPAFQKNSLSGVTSGSGRPGGPSAKLSLGLADRDRLGQPLLVADLLHRLDGLVTWALAPRTSASSDWKSVV